ncbi:phage minor tail protein L [Escherichia coli]|uniref:phage minor tail protein L n=2 Tax=Escherichia coli TaxID=562 RepID=UPI003B27B647
MQDIQQETLNECIRAEQSASVVLWEIDLTEVGGDRYFFCNEQNEKGESVTWQSRQYQAYPIQGSGFEMNGKGSAARPTLTVSNLHGMVTGMAEDLQSLVGGTVVRRKVYARFLDAVNFVNGNSEPAQNPQKRLPHRQPVRRRHRHHLRLLQKMRRPDRRQQRRVAPRRHPRRRQRQLAVRRQQLRAKVRRNLQQRALRQRQNGQRILHPPWRLRMRARRKRG